ncbi:hypothetical protein QE152_g12570 [Popillia japonica]|uniref:Uncharacterized protein n=1 Tax=Popillia japonica TaxID=7064 RepID=A0AAW1LQR5_POPJA
MKFSFLSFVKTLACLEKKLAVYALVLSTYMYIESSAFQRDNRIQAIIKPRKSWLMLILYSLEIDENFSNNKTEKKLANAHTIFT